MLTAKDLLPPILVRLVRRCLSSLSEDEGVVNNPVYDRYDDAIAACRGFGYQDLRLIDIIYAKTKIYCEKLVTNHPKELTSGDTLGLLGIYLASHCKRPVVNVIDFGGACGAHYFLMKSVVGDTIKLR
jgi:hypothetical protein